MTIEMIIEIVMFVLGGSGLGILLNHIANKKLERFKKGLECNSKISEMMAMKRHEICAEIYKLIRIVEGAVKNLHGLRRSSTYEDYDIADFSEMLMKRNVLRKQIAKFTRYFDEDDKAGIPIDKNRGVREWKEYSRVLDVNEAHHKVTEVRNYLVLNELYLSKNLREKFYKIISDLDMLIFDIEHEAEAPRFNRPNTFKNEKELGMIIDNLVNDIQNEVATTSL